MLIFDRDEWEAAFILNKKRPPKLQEVVLLVAMQRGFLGRKGDGELGMKLAGSDCNGRLHAWKQQ